MTKLTPAEIERIMRERDHHAWLSHPDLWPNWPFQTIKRNNPFDDGNMGFVISTNLEGPPTTPIRVIVGLLGLTDPNTDVREYDSIDELLADGWEVD